MDSNQSTTTEAARSEAPEAAAGNQETFCIECGYALATLPKAGRCPECARPVADSLGGWRLQNIDRRYVRVLRVGLLATILGTVLFVAGFVIGDIWRLGMVQGFGGGAAGDVGWHTRALVTAGSLSLVCGVWLLTRANRKAPAAYPQTGWRWTARVASIVYAAGCLLLPWYGQWLADYTTAAAGSVQGLADLNKLFALTSRLASLEMYLLRPTIVLSRAVLLLALMRYGRGLARRAGDEMLAGRFAVWSWILPIMALSGLWTALVQPGNEELYYSVRLMTPMSLAVACLLLWRLHGRVRRILVEN